MIVVSATNNQHKLAEIRAIVKPLGMEVVTLGDMGLPPTDILEDGTTFEENSEKKAVAVMKLSNQVAIADDSGLSTYALSGAPGVYSARFAGEEADDQANNEKLLRLLKEQQDRSAKFVSVITMAWPDGRKLVARGECPGRIVEAPAGEGGFGYDPLFVPEGEMRTFGEMSAEEKNRISHRAKALKVLQKLLQEDSVNSLQKQD